MKMFKLILNCVLSVLLVFSIVLNILLLCGFEFRREAQEPTTSQTVTTTHNKKNPCTEDAKVPDKNSTGPQVDISETVSTSEMETVLVYEDNNVKVSYVETQQDVFGIIHKFKIENNTAKTLTLSFTDVVINNQKVYISGLTCENLLPGTSVVEDFVLLESEWSQFTSAPNDINFIIKLVNAKSRLDWYESDQIKLTF